jgi:hypothetical protein
MAEHMKNSCRAGAAPATSLALRNAFFGAIQFPLAAPREISTCEIMEVDEAILTAWDVDKK